MLSDLAPRPSFGDRAVDPADADGLDPLSLPDAWSPSPKPPFPLAASTVPVIGAVALWLATGSMLSLLLAALGPLIAVASVLDGRRAGRRERKRAAATADAARALVLSAVSERHSAERARRWSRHPDVAAFLARDGEIWRAGRPEGLVIGSGDAPSSLRVTGGAGDPHAAAVRARAARLADAPLVVSPGRGIVVRGPAATAAAVHRALAVQLCLALPPGELRVVGALHPEFAWADGLPHRLSTTGLRLALVGPGEVAPVDAEVVLAFAAPDAPAPPGCGIVLAVDAPDRARLDQDGEVVPVAVEALGRDQAALVVEVLAERAARTLGLVPERAEPVAFGTVVESAPVARRGALAAAIGIAGGEASVVDLVSDGPHAVVAGVTGSGKSELLITWVLALAATHTTRQVSFLLADFKGGTAFDALAGLPHVTGVITDLDGSGARRAIESLRAEVRWREAELARRGARDILDPRVDLPRLVVVVDEFAALLGDHPELHAVFGDIAARGRALGLHLVLGTQRVSGVVRDALLANCALRISLRVADAADSRAVIGTDAAAAIPGGVEGRGIALVRRAGDGAAHRVRIALSAPEDVRTVVARSDGPAPRRPWLPELPSLVRLGDLRTGAGDGRLILGLADEPERQRQEAVSLRIGDRGLLVVGGPGSGKSTALRMLAAQAAGEVVRVPSTGEGAWDAVAALVENPPAPGAVVVVDDLDAVSSRLPHDHAHELIDRLERVFRGAGDSGILVLASAQRLTGAAARLGELLPRRLVLGTATKADHLAAGGDPAHYSPGAPAGRGRFGGVAVQVAIADDPACAQVSTATAGPAPWHPSGPLSGLVARRSPRVSAALAAWAERGIRSVSLDDYAADPSVTAEGPVVLVGDPDDWQRHWRQLASVRADHDLVIDTACAAEYRVLTGSRSLPPFAEPGSGRAWLMSAGAEPARIVLPGSAGGSRHPRELP
ncbi:MAG: FtsK/SpoIIIE domain-containing protein [Microbacterium sp.]